MCVRPPYGFGSVLNEISAPAVPRIRTCPRAERPRLRRRTYGRRARAGNGPKLHTYSMFTGVIRKIRRHVGSSRPRRNNNVRRARAVRHKERRRVCLRTHGNYIKKWYGGGRDFVPPRRRRTGGSAARPRTIKSNNDSNNNFSLMRASAGRSPPVVNDTIRVQWACTRTACDAETTRRVFFVRRSRDGRGNSFLITNE